MNAEVKRLMRRTDEAAMDFMEAQRKKRSPEVIERKRQYWLNFVAERDHAIQKATR